MNVTLIGIDLAKSVFQVCAVNQAGKTVFNRPVRRHRLMALLAQYPEAIIAMEACSGSNFWGRELEARGQPVRLIPPQHVKPFVKGNKNDRNDAFAITEAAQRPQLCCVRPRSLEQTDLIQVHRVVDRQVRQRTAMINQIRGFLMEYGIVVPRGKERLQQALPELLEDGANALTAAARLLLAELHREWRHQDAVIERLQGRIKDQVHANEAACRLMKIKGVGERIASAIVAHAGNASGVHLIIPGRAVRCSRPLTAPDGATRQPDFASFRGRQEPSKHRHVGGRQLTLPFPGNRLSGTADLAPRDGSSVPEKG